MLNLFIRKRISNEALILACVECFFGHLRLCLTRSKDAKGIKSTKSFSSEDILVGDISTEVLFEWEIFV